MIVVEIRDRGGFCFARTTFDSGPEALAWISGVIPAGFGGSVIVTGSLEQETT